MTFSLYCALPEKVSSVANSKLPPLRHMRFVRSPQWWRMQTALPKTTVIVFIPFYFPLLLVHIQY